MHNSIIALLFVFKLILVTCADVQFKIAPATLQIKSSLTQHAKHSQQLLKQPIDQQVQQHLHQFQLQQQLSSPQPLMSSVATLVPSSMTPTLITASTGSPLGTTTSFPASKAPSVTSMSPILASSLITTSSASSASTSSKASRAVLPSKSSNTYDWDLIYKVISRFTDLSNISQGIKRSIAGSSESSFSPSTLNSLLYGLSMAAGLAVGVSIADSPMVSSFLNRVDHRFLTRSSNRFYGDSQQQPNLLLNPMTNSPSSITPSAAASSNSNLVSASPTTGYFGLFDSSASSESKSLSDPIVQRNVASSKDGKDHYHHVVHYHIPYPLSVGALETAKGSYPNIPWFSSDSISHRHDFHSHSHPNHQSSNNGHNSKMSILTGYLGPFFGHSSSGNSFKDTLASRISSLPFIGSSIMGSSSNLAHSPSSSSMATSDFYHSNNDGQGKNSYLFNHRNPELNSGHDHRYNYNYNSDNNGWQGRDHNNSYFNSHNGAGSSNTNSYDYSASSFNGFSDQSDHGIRRNDPYQVFSDSEYFKSLTHGQSNDQKVTKKKSGGRKNRPKKPTMDELIYTGNSSPTASASASSGVNLLDQSSTSSPSSSTSSTLSDLLTVTNS